MRGEKTVQKQVIERAPAAAALDFRVGNHDQLRDASVYNSLEDCRVRLYPRERGYLLSVTVKTASFFVYN